MIQTRPLPIQLLIMTLVCGFTQSCDQHQSPLVEGIVASVNGTEITQEDLTLASRTATGGHQEQEPSADKVNVLEQIIMQELTYQHAIKLGLDADPAYQAELRGMEAQLNAFKRKKLSEILLQRELLQKAKVSDAEAEQYFNNNAARLRTEINVWQILLRSENAIKKIQSELAQGLPFEEVAGKQFPNLPENGRKPWELGYLRWSQIPEIWRNVIYDLSIGETSDIIRGPKNRFWIIKLNDKRENPDASFEKIKPKIIEIMQSEKAKRLREEILRDLRVNAHIVKAPVSE